MRSFFNTAKREAKAITLGILFCWLGNSSQVFAQNENYLIEDSIIDMTTDETFATDMSFTIKSMNVFRGLLPSRAPAFSTGQEYYRPKFNIRADWCYNFTDGITNMPKVISDRTSCITNYLSAICINCNWSYSDNLWWNFIIMLYE